MTLSQHSTVAVIRPLDIVLAVDEIEVTLDEGFAPYCLARRVVCQLPTGDDRTAIDLREGPLRVDLQLRRDFGTLWTLADLDVLGGNDLAVMDDLFGGQPLAAIENLLHTPWNPSGIRPAQAREFDLGVTAREFDDVAKTLTLELASDEALLIGDMLLADDPLDPGTTSLAAIVDQVLARYGAHLAADALDGTVAEADATLWQPGTTAWEYLDALLEPASLRLWCDERRRWRLTARQGTVEGALALTPSNMTKHRDRMTADPDVWADAVLVRYRWTDAFDLNAEQIDYAGAQPSTSPLLVERTSVYPGPGAAAGILNRMQGRGRVLDVDADSNYTASPGQAVTVTPPDTVALTGYASAITWRRPENEMTVATRGLVDTPDTAIIFGPPGYRIIDVPAGIAPSEFDWSMA